MLRAITHVHRITIAQPMGNFFLWIAKGLDAIHTEEQLDKLALNGGKMYRTTVEPFELVSVPMGTITIERVLGDRTVFGYRTSFTDTSKGALDGFKNMLKCVAATKQDPSADPVVKFWNEVVDIHAKAIHDKADAGAKKE